ncbi:MAG: hypothetical protein HY782_24115 [Chloroflexi bacterium]|nr:hypothetical protein [Chloroflexota bacterium]
MKKQRRILLVVVFALIVTLAAVACRGREDGATPPPEIAPTGVVPGGPPMVAPGAQPTKATGITPPASSQLIQSFTTDDEIVTAGQCTNLRWLVTGTAAVTLDGQRVTGDSKQVCPTRTTRYTLAAGSEKEKLAVAVLPPPAAPTQAPKIIIFDADDPQVLPGQATVLRWSVEGAQLVMLNDETQMQPEPNLRVRPAETTTYRLVAINRLGQDEKEFTVQVGQPAPPPVIKTFDADDPELIPPKSTTTLRWDVTGAERVTLDERPMTEPNKKVTIHETTKFTLKAYARGRDQPVTRELTVKVSEPRTNNPAQIVSFDADHPTLKSGQLQTVGAGCTVLRWDVRDAGWIKLDGKEVSGTNTQICPRVTKTYTLTAGRGTQKPASKTTTVKVGDTRGAGAGDYIEIKSVRQAKDDKGAQIAEVQVNYGLTAATLQQKKDLRLQVSAMVWNDLEGEEQALSQFFALPRPVQAGQRDVTLTLKYEGWKQVVSDHVLVEMIEQQPSDPVPSKEAGKAPKLTKLPNESVPAVFLTAAYEHPDMIWKPVTWIRQVEVKRGLLASELKVLVAYAYNGDHGDNIVLGAEPTDAVAVKGGAKVQQFGYVAGKLKIGQPGVAVVTVRYNGAVDAKSGHLRVFMHSKSDPRQRFEEKDIVFAHSWSPIDIRITQVKRAPGNALLVGVAYAMNIPVDVAGECAKLYKPGTKDYDTCVAWGADVKNSMIVSFSACDKTDDRDVKKTPIAGKGLLSDPQPSCGDKDRRLALWTTRWASDASPTFSQVASIKNATYSYPTDVLSQGHGTAWFLVWHEGTETLETDLLEVYGSDGLTAAARKVVGAKPVSYAWKSNLLGEFTFTCNAQDGNTGTVWQVDWKDNKFQQTGRAYNLSAAMLSQADCVAVQVACNQSKTARLAPRVDKGTPTPVPTPETCKSRTSKPEVIVGKGSQWVPVLGDIVRMSGKDSPDKPSTLLPPFKMEYIGSPVLTVHVTYGDLMVRGLPVAIADCTGAKCPRGPVLTDENGDAVFYDAILSPNQYVTVKVVIPPEDKQLYVNYTAQKVHVGEGEEHEADVTPSYIVGILDSATFYQDEDGGVDEWVITTEGHLGQSDCSTTNACLPNMWPWFEQDLYAQAAWYEAEGGDVVAPHLPIFLLRADAMERLNQNLTLKVSGIDNDFIAEDWFKFADVITGLVKWAAEVVSYYYTGSTEAGEAVGNAIQNGTKALMGWLSKPEALGTWQISVPRPTKGWANMEDWVSQGFTQGDVSATVDVVRKKPIPGRKLYVKLKNIHIGDDGDDAAIRGAGDIIVYTRVCNGPGCTTIYHTKDALQNPWQVEDGKDLRLDKDIFGGKAVGPDNSVGPYLYIEVGVWDYDGWAENADMLGTVSTLLTDDDNFGVGAPLVLSGAGYGGGPVTVELEVNWVW